MGVRRAPIPQQYDVQVVHVPDGDAVDRPRNRALARVQELESQGWERVRVARRGWFGAEAGADWHFRRPSVGYSRERPARPIRRRGPAP
jgi:hypothetical protein